MTAQSTPTPKRIRPNLMVSVRPETRRLLKSLAAMEGMTMGKYLERLIAEQAAGKDDGE